MADLRHASARALRQVERRVVQHSECLGNRRRDERGVPNCGQPDEQHTACALVRDRARKLQRQTGLPDASRPDERDETCSGIGEPVAVAPHVGVAAEKGRERQGQGDVTQFIDCRGVSGSPRARKQRVTGRTAQVKSRGQRAHGLDVRPPSFPALQRADAMN